MLPGPRAGRPNLPAGKNHAPRMKLCRTIILLIAGLFLLTPPSLMWPAPLQLVPFVGAAAVAPIGAATNHPTRTLRVSSREIKTPVEPGKQGQARLLAALGMVIISLLALAVAVALLRSLRQH